MSFSFKGGRWVLFALLSLGGIGCSTDPESFCAEQVEQICKVLAGCCNGSAKFDQEGCELQISAACENQYNVEGVHAGEYVFDSGAADSCYGNIETCDDITDPEPLDKDRVKACGNALTGHRPPGAACTEHRQCEKSGGDYPACHAGAVCAKAILSEEECGFSFETNELFVCMPGMYCDVREDDTPNPNTPPTIEALEFSGKCKSPLSKGQKCLPDGMKLLPCKEGLICQFDSMDLKSSTCQPLKGKGEACQSSSECASGLFCDFNGTTLVCADSGAQNDDPGLFCFQPPVCGDGTCEEPYETEETCAADCSSCGDGICQFNGTEPVTCPQDCCGDGVCDPGEADVCPTDCNP